MKKIKFLIATLALTSLVTSCDNYLDVNDNPNKINEADIRPDQILPGAMVMTYRVQARSMNVLGNRMMQTWYGNINDVTGLDVSPEFTLNIDNTFYSDIWDNLYLGLGNFVQLQNYNSLNFDNHKAIAMIMEAYYMQYIVDLYGDAPYAEAFKGSDNITPAYQDDQAIYRALVDKLNAAINLIDDADANDEIVGAEDVMYAGDMAAWQNFANLVKMRILLRQSELSGAATQTYIQDEFDKINTFGIPSAVSTTINPGYSNATASQQNPFYGLFYSITDDATQYNSQTRASGYIADFLNGDLNGVVDPRRSFLYEVDGSGDVVGAYQGENDGYDNVELSKVISQFPSATSDGIIMSASEAWFLLAEAFEKGYLSGDAQTAFNNGIQASFNFLGAPNYATYIANIDAVAGLGWNGGNHIEAIMTQKWLAVNGINPIESWIDYTRTGYPNVPLALTAIYPNRPYRLMYPLSEFVANSANVPSLTQAQLFSQGPFWKN